MTSYATRTQSSSDQNDLKKLKSKYSSKLSTLQELFADWSDDDLLFALDEADGVLEVAVERISEGHATQWGEVKTKKTKKEAQQKAKAAAATTVPSASQTMSYQRPERSFTDRPKSTKVRAPSTNNYSKKPAATTTTSSWGYNSSSKPSSSSALDTAAGSWASIASTKPAHDSSSDWNTTSNTSFATTANDLRDHQSSSSWVSEDHTETTTSSALLDDADKPKSWASLLKSQPKPEPEPVQETGPIEQQQQQQQQQQQKHSEVVEDAWSKKDNDPVIDEFNAPVETPVDAWGSTTAEPEVTSKFTSELTEDNDSRSPITMPDDDATLASVDLKFGSLNLDNDAAQQPTQTEESLTDTKVEAQAPPPATTQPALEQTITANDQQHVQQSSTLTKEEPVYTQSQTHQQSQQVPAPVTTQVQQPQQLSQQNQLHHPQQTPLSVDHLTSAYNSYLPNQHLTGFGMNPMGNVPDYSTYGTEAQRAAAMGYYDPSAFNNSPITTNASTHPSRDKFGQDTSAPIGQTQGLHGQQMYPGMPYYPYYYMPNHYNAYQQSMYGQPMMNKSMYPNMYQQQQPQQQSQQSASVSKPSAQSSYGNGAAANASPYALHSQLYNQSGSGMGGYDDLQQQFGLHDYQKSPYANTGGQQLQGFLGNHLQGHQQQPSQQSQAQSQSVDPTKSTMSSQPQQQHHQMNNYFGQQQQQQQQQQQMFNYQQYPQQQYWNQ